MKRWKPLALVAVFLMSFGLEASAREFDLANGDALTGEAVSMRNGIVIFEPDEGGKMMLSLDKFSKADQAYLLERFPEGNKDLPKPKAPPPKPKKKTTPPSPPAEKAADAGHPGLKNYRVGQEPPAFSARIQGSPERFNLKDARGKVVLVNFWSTRSEHSLAEIKRLGYFNKYYSDSVQILGVALDDSQRRVNAYEKNLGITWPVLMDGGRALQEAWGVQALPTTVLIDQNGIIVRENIAAAELEPLLRQLLKLPPLPEKK